MVSLASLWIAILASAAAVFVVSSALHMLFSYHEGDLKELSNQEKVRAVLNEGDLSPGEYLIPYAEGSEERQSEEYVEKLKEGPVAFLTVQESGPIEMGGDLAKWFLYSVVVSVFVAYVTGQVLASGSGFTAVFQIASTTAFMAYGMAFPQDGIFYGKPWSSVGKALFDAVLYGLATGAVFAALWPAA